MTLILASNSPRRRQLLAFGGWDFSILAAPVDECVWPGEIPADYVARLSVAKAQAILPQLVQPVDSGLFIIAADTTVIHATRDGDWEILGKPQDVAEAWAMLRHLRGHAHQVYTAVTVLHPQDDTWQSGVCITSVPMRNYNDAEIAAYIASGDPFDKAGGYAIQHNGFQPVDGLAGCFANVMGLPVCHLSRLLARFRVPAQADIPRVCQKALDYSCPIYEQVLHIDQPFDVG